MNASIINYYRASLSARIQAAYRSWRCGENILVFESDDWGSVRTSTPEAYQKLISSGYKLNRSFWHLDSLETDDDLTALFNVLEKFKDIRGCPACFTGNIVMANPDFTRIRSSCFSNYYIEDVTKTLKANSNRTGVAKLWRDGMNSKLFRPQLHAREHIRWWEWMAALREGSQEALDTFEFNMCGLQIEASKEGVSFFNPIYVNNHLFENDTINLTSMIKEGFLQFEELFGFKSLSTIAPFCAWTDKVEKIWSTIGVKYIQGSYCQHVVSDHGIDYIKHYIGERSRYGSLHLVRNCSFEPASNLNNDILPKTLAQIKRAFKLGIPAIVSTHRVNYIGSILEANRKRGLSQLEKLLDEVLTAWPDVHFLSSAELGYMIENDLQRAVDLELVDNKIYPTTMPIAIQH